MFLVQIVEVGVLGRLWCGGIARSGEVNEITCNRAGEKVFRGARGWVRRISRCRSFVNASMLRHGCLQIVGN